MNPKLIMEQVTNENKGWYAIHTYSGYENKVKTNLEKRIESMNMEDYIFRIVVPTEDVEEKKNNKLVTSKRKIFPGYVLVEMIMTDDSWYVVRNTTGVTGFVGMGTKPVPLKDYEVTELLRLSGMDDPRQIIDYNVGDAVEILDGSFTGMIGNVESIDAEKGKVIVMMNLFGGRETPVDLEYHQVLQNLKQKLNFVIFIPL